MCITNPQVLPLERIVAFKVMLKVKGGYRPVFYHGAMAEPRVFEVGKKYWGAKGFHACQSLNGAIETLKTLPHEWNCSDEVDDNPQNLRIVLVELTSNVVCGIDERCPEIPPQLRGHHMTILGVWKGRKS